MVSAYLNKSENKGVIVAINPTKEIIGLDIQYPNGSTLDKAFQTDRYLDCEHVKASSPLNPKAVRTIVYTF